MISRFSFPTDIHFGAGARWQVAEHLKDLGLKRPLIVTDRVVSTLGFFDELKRGLGHSGLMTAVFYELSANPLRPEVVSGVDAFHAHDADCIVAIGGGAPLDAAKAIALMVRHPGDLFDYEDGAPGSRPIDGNLPYWVAIPTTSGTGSEVGRSAVISDEKTHLKKIIFSPHLLARAVFADPELTLKLPPAVTAATGMDALAHCIEAYLARGYHPLCEAVAIEGFRLIAKNLRTAVEDPTNLDARSEMLMASMMGAIAFQKGLGLTHSCAHALSTVHGLHHGLANGVMIDHALIHNIPAATPAFQRLAAALPGNAKHLPEALPEKLIEWIVDLKRGIGIPLSLQTLKIQRSSLDQLSEIAVNDVCHQSNPRPCHVEDFRKVFSAAFE